MDDFELELVGKHKEEYDMWSLLKKLCKIEPQTIEIGTENQLNTEDEAELENIIKDRRLEDIADT